MVVEFSERSLFGLARRGSRLLAAILDLQVLLALRFVKQRKHLHVVVLEAHADELAIAAEAGAVHVLREAEALYRALCRRVVNMNLEPIFFVF